MPTSVLVDGQGCEIGTIAGPAEWDSDDAVKLITAATTPRAPSPGRLRFSDVVEVDCRIGLLRKRLDGSQRRTGARRNDAFGGFRQLR